MKKNSAKTVEGDRIVWSPAPVPDKSRLAALGENGQELHGVPTLQTRYPTVSVKVRKTQGFMLLGEQPGDQEDLAGKPFVGGRTSNIERRSA